MNSFSKKEVPKEGKQNRQGFSFLSKPESEGPLGAKTSPKGIENRIFEDLKWFGWDEKFIKSVIEIKRNLFREDECFSRETEGQLDAVNLHKKINGMSVSLTINRFFAYFSIISVSSARKHKSTDEICDVIRELLPEMQLTITEKKLEDIDGFSIHVEGNIQREKKEKVDLRYPGYGC